MRLTDCVVHFVPRTALLQFPQMHTSTILRILLKDTSSRRCSLCLCDMATRVHKAWSQQYMYICRLWNFRPYSLTRGVVGGIQEFQCPLWLLPPNIGACEGGYQNQNQRPTPLDNASWSVCQHLAPWSRLPVLLGVSSFYDRILGCGKDRSRTAFDYDSTSHRAPGRFHSPSPPPC